ncbi:MAG: PEP-CTERM sorting domain-containing protein [Pseudomonadales bacterium]
MKSLRWVGLVAVLLSPVIANAGIVYTYEGYCTVGDCGSFPNVSGFVEFADGSLGDGVASGGDVIDWGMLFGAHLLDPGNSWVWGALAVGPGGFEVFPDLSLEGLFFQTSLLSFGVTGSVTFDGVTLEGWKVCVGFFCNKKFAGGPGEYKPVPEPGTLALLGGGLLGLSAIVRRRQRKA